MQCTLPSTLGTSKDELCDMEPWMDWVREEVPGPFLESTSSNSEDNAFPFQSILFGLDA